MTTNNLGLDQKPVSTKTPFCNTDKCNQRSNSFSCLYYPRSPKIQELIARHEAVRAAEVKATEVEHKPADHD
jgi:hypothetical protein